MMATCRHRFALSARFCKRALFGRCSPVNKRLKTLAARGKRGESFKAWLIMLPGLVLMTLFVWEPLLESVRMSLYKTENVELV